MQNKNNILYIGQLIHDHIQEKCEYLKKIRELNMERVDLIQSMNAQALIEQDLRKKYDKTLGKLQCVLNEKYQAEDKLEKVMRVITSNTDINVIRSRTLKIMIGQK